MVWGMESLLEGQWRDLIVGSDQRARSMEQRWIRRAKKKRPARRERRSGPVALQATAADLALPGRWRCPLCGGSGVSRPGGGPLTEQGEHLLRQLVGLGHHRRAGLLQDLGARQV